MTYFGEVSTTQRTGEGWRIRLCPVCENGLFGSILGKSSGETQQSTHQRSFLPGDVIYRKGSRGRSVYAVCKGSVKLEAVTPDGLPRIVRVLQVGDVFGLEVLSDVSYHHAATCLGRTQVCEIPADAINDGTLHDAALHQSLMHLWQSNADDADVVIAELCTGSSRLRLARLLLHLTRGHVTHTCPTMGREDMASLLDLTPETVSRTMAAFKRSGLVAERSGVMVCDIPGLQRISQGTEAPAG